MAKAHEEKVRALARVEAQYKDRIAALEARVQELEGPHLGQLATSTNSYAFPATNRMLAEKVKAYQVFLSDYLVKASAEKQNAIRATEARVTAKYEAIIARMQGASEEKN